MSVKALILRGPGTNCDHETEHALAEAGAATERVHIHRFLDEAEPRRLDEFDLLVLPGGFSYADDISAGRVFANKLRFGLGDALNAFVAAGKPVLGICNGFQILMETGVLQLDPRSRSASLGHNDSGRFECRWTRLQVDRGSRCRLLEGLDDFVAWPVAHAEGKFVCSPEVLAALEGAGRVALRYGDEHARYPENPNGSVGRVAGLCDESGLVLGLMPHPERSLARRDDPSSAVGGRRLFENLVKVAGERASS